VAESAERISKLSRWGTPRYPHLLLAFSQYYVFTRSENADKTYTGPCKSSFYQLVELMVISSRRDRITDSSTLIPVHSSIPATPWFTSIPSPSMVEHPMDAQFFKNLVWGGFGITSATIIA
jgi:hypothetical protein